MTEMIERVAESLFERTQDRQERGGNFNQVMFGRADRVTWAFITSSAVRPFLAEQFREDARAAIAAIRDPTQDMLDAGAEAFGHYTDNIESTHLWQAMIDAALGGNK